MQNTQTMKLFLVDDDTFSLHLYQQNIRNLGYNDVMAFENGMECLNNLNRKPEVVFLDHNMDNLSGFEVLKKIKRVDPNIFVVMVSAQENMKTAVDALKYGAFDYIIKGDNELLKIENVLSRIELIKEEMKKGNPGLLQRLLSVF